MVEHTIALRLAVPEGTNPATWDWHRLLDMGPEERAHVFVPSTDEATVDRCAEAAYRTNNPTGIPWLSLPTSIREHHRRAVRIAFATLFYRR